MLFGRLEFVLEQPVIGRQWAAEEPHPSLLLLPLLGKTGHVALVSTALGGAVLPLTLEPPERQIIAISEVAIVAEFRSADRDTSGQNASGVCRQLIDTSRGWSGAPPESEERAQLNRPSLVWLNRRYRTGPRTLSPPGSSDRQSPGLIPSAATISARRFIHHPELQLRKAAKAKPIGVAAVQLERRIEIGDRPRKLAKIEIDDAAADECGRLFGIQLQDRIVVLQSLIVRFPPDMHLRSQAAGADRLGIRPNGSVFVGEGFVEIALLKINEAPFGESTGVRLQP